MNIIENNEDVSGAREVKQFYRFRTRNQVGCRDAILSDSFDSEISVNSLEGFDDEAVVEMLREEGEYVGDTVADAVINGIDEEGLLDNSYSNFCGEEF